MNSTRGRCPHTRGRAFRYFVAALALAVTGCDDGTIGKTPTVLLFHTTQWVAQGRIWDGFEGRVQVGEDSAAGMFMLRYIPPAEVVHALRRPGPFRPSRESWEDTVYRFDYRTRTFEHVEASAWDEAGEGTCDPADRHPMPEGLEKEIDGRTIRCRAKGEGGQVTESKFRIREGKVITRARVSPNGRYIAVVSAAEYKDSFMPFIGYEGPAGQYYLQILTLPELAPVGETIPIPMARGGQMFISCDGSYIVCVVDEKFEKICVIPVEIPEEKETR